MGAKILLTIVWMFQVANWVYERRPTRIRFIMYLIVAASTPHLAAGFNALERQGDEWRGWLQAFGFDGGVLVVEHAITSWIGNKTLRYFALWLLLVAFVVATTFVRIGGAVAVLTGAERVTLGIFYLLDAWQFAEVFLLAGIIPLVVVGLAFTGEDRQDRPKTAFPRFPFIPTLPQLVENHVQNLPQIAVEQVAEDGDSAMEIVPKEDIAVFSQVNVDPRLLAPPSELPTKLSEAVLLYATHKSYSKAAKFSNYSRETIRTQVDEAKAIAPNWVAMVLSGLTTDK